MTQSIRIRVRAALVAATAALGAIGVVVVSTFPATPANNIGLDCRFAAADAGVGRGSCTSILEPPRAACIPLMATGGEPPGGPDAGTAVQTRVVRGLEQMRTAGAIDAWHCEAATIDAGPSCWCDVRLSVSRDAAGHLEGQAPAWRDVIDAAGTGSIVRDGRVSARPAYALRGGCRAHVLFGEDPCAAGGGVDGGSEPDGGP